MNKYECAECGTVEDVRLVRLRPLCSDCELDSLRDKSFEKKTKKMSLRKARFDKQNRDE